MDKVVYRPNKPQVSEKKSEVAVPHVFNSWVVKVAFVVISSVLLYSVYKSIVITSQKLDILRQAEQEVEELRLRNLSLSIQMEEMSSDQFLEKEARNRLNFGVDGEVVFVLPPNSLQMAKEEVARIVSSKENVSLPSEAFSTWKEFILKGI